MSYSVFTQWSKPEANVPQMYRIYSCTTCALCVMFTSSCKHPISEWCTSLTFHYWPWIVGTVLAAQRNEQKFLANAWCEIRKENTKASGSKFKKIVWCVLFSFAVFLLLSCSCLGLTVSVLWHRDRYMLKISWTDNDQFRSIVFLFLNFFSLCQRTTM